MKATWRTTFSMEQEPFSMNNLSNLVNPLIIANLMTSMNSGSVMKVIILKLRAIQA